MKGKLSRENSYKNWPIPALQLFSTIRESCQKEGIKIVSANIAAHEHTFYWLLESDDIAAMERALKPMLTLGNAHLVPVQAMDFMLS